MSISYTADQLQKKFQGAPGASGFARIAETLREEGRQEEAVALCQEGLRQQPRSLTGRLVLGKCFIDMDRLEEAREQLEGALRQDPRCLSAMHLLAGIMTRLQWGEAAAAYYRSILELEPWDTGSLARFRELSPSGAAGMAPAATEAASAVPPFQTLEALTAAAPSGPEVEEFDLNDVTGFPADESTPGDLAGALEEVSLEDALGAPAAESRAFAPAPPMPSLEEPRPLDLLAAEPASPAETGAGAPAPISGDDVGDRLDSLFGTEDDKPLAPLPDPSAGPVDAELADATLQLKALRDLETKAPDLGSAPTFPGPAADFAWGSADAAGREAEEDAFRPDAGVREESASPLETQRFAGGDLLPPEERVSGEDIEARLDDLFSLHDTSTQPVMKAVPDEAPAAEPVPPAPEAVGTWSGAAPAHAVPEETAADAPAAEGPGSPDLEEPVPAAEDVFLPVDPLEPAPALPEGDLVTGQDVADKLEALFGEEPARPDALSRDAGEPETLAGGSASWAAARPAADDAAAAAAAEEAAPAAEAGAAADRPAIGANQAAAPVLPADAAPAWDEDLESAQPPAADFMTTESMLPRGLGMDPGPPITGEDIEARLDSLFDLAEEGSLSGSAPRASGTEPGTGPAPEEVTLQVPEAGASAGPVPAEGFGDADRTLMMPVVKETAADWLARQADAPGAGKGSAEAPREPGAGDTLFIRNEDVFAQESVPVSGATDAVGLEMVDGADVAERLDRIFAAEGADPRGEDAPAAAADALPAFPEPEAAAATEDPVLPETAPGGLETGSEMEVAAPLDEVALFDQDPGAALPLPDDGFLDASGTGDGPGETVISGDDIKARLSEIFDAPAGQDIRPMEDEEPETPFFLANPGLAPSGAAAEDGGGDLPPPVPDLRTPAADAGTRAPETGGAATSLAPLMDEEEGSPEEEENAPQSAAGANVATVTLAEIYFQQGLREQALQIYRQLLEREPGNDSVRKRIQEIEASKPEAGTGPGPDPRRPRPGLKVPKRKK